MKGNLGQYMTALGFCALGFYGVMFGCGYLGLAAMPQFVAEELRREPDWAWLTAFMNWTAALLIIALLAILLMKPAELSLLDAFKFSPSQSSFFAGAVP